MKLMVTFSLFILVFATGCHHAPKELFNDGAALPSGVPVQPLTWRVINSSIDPVHQTMSTLYGNDLAIDSARTPNHTEYLAGAVIARVTWSQKEDEHWFGARIPKQFQSMEIVRIEQGADGKLVSHYERQTGPGQQTSADTAAEVEAKKNSILGQRASVMP
jgi:hypothetical protein